MARAQFSSGYTFKANFGFRTTQTNIALAWQFEDPRYEVIKNNRKEYTVEIDPGFGTTTRYSIRGNLREELTFDERTVGTVKTEVFDTITGQLLSSAQYSGIRDLTLRDFFDTNLNGFGKAFDRGDEIIGNEGEDTILTGLRGNDKIFVKSQNLAFGGPGKDQFIFSKDTRFAEILDFNAKKDKLIIEDDFASNYRISNFFGEVSLQNLEGDIIAFISNFNDTDLLPDTNVVSLI